MTVNNAAGLQELDIRPATGVMSELLARNGVEGWRVLTTLVGKNKLATSVDDREGDAIPLLVKGLVDRYYSDGEVRIDALHHISDAFGGEQRYADSINLWMDQLGGEVDRVNYRRLSYKWRTMRAVDGAFYVDTSSAPLDWNKFCVDVDMVPSEKGILVVSEFYAGKNVPSPEVREKINSAASQAVGLWGVPDQGTSMSVLMLPQENLRVGGVQSGRDMLIGVHGPEVDTDYLLHEMTHVLLDQCGHTDLSDSHEGVAEGARLVAGSNGKYIQIERDRLPESIARAKQMIAKGVEVKPSSTALLETKDKIPIWIEGYSYEMGKAVMALALLFQDDWPKIAKSFFEATTDRNRSDTVLYDDMDGSPMLVAGKPMAARKDGSEIRRRDILHSALKRGLIDVLGDNGLEAANAMAVSTFGLDPEERKSENVATMVEALAVAIMGGEKVIKS